MEDWLNKTLDYRTGEKLPLEYVDKSDDQVIEYAYYTLTSGDMNKWDEDVLAELLVRYLRARQGDNPIGDGY